MIITRVMSSKAMNRRLAEYNVKIGRTIFVSTKTPLKTRSLAFCFILRDVKLFPGQCKMVHRNKGRDVELA